eukprot:XP_008180128.1 PREDICTED: protein mahjong-like [Acyrthosiphon pisum]
MEQSISEVTNLLQKWEDEISTPNYNPIPMLIKLCELFEAESKKYHKKDRDPFVDRDPFRIDHTCVLGQMYKILIFKDSLINKLVMDYSIGPHWPRQINDEHDLNVAACRLILNIIPGLETTVVFKSPENDQFIQRLFTWAENTNEPLQTYATGLLASCMELSHIAANFKFLNDLLVRYKPTSTLNSNEVDNTVEDSNQCINICFEEPPSKSSLTLELSITYSLQLLQDSEGTEDEREENGICGDSDSSASNSNANWIQIDQPTLTTKLVYCLKYLVPTGQYQEPTKTSRAEVQEEIELLSNYVSLKSHWTPIDQLLKLGGLRLLFKIISLGYAWNFYGRQK